MRPRPRPRNSIGRSADTPRLGRSFATKTAHVRSLRSVSLTRKRIGAGGPLLAGGATSQIHTAPEGMRVCRVVALRARGTNRAAQGRALARPGPGRGRGVRFGARRPRRPGPADPALGGRAPPSSSPGGGRRRTKRDFSHSALSAEAPRPRPGPLRAGGWKRAGRTSQRARFLASETAPASSPAAATSCQPPRRSGLPANLPCADGGWGGCSSTTRAWNECRSQMSVSDVGLVCRLLTRRGNGSGRVCAGNLFGALHMFGGRASDRQPWAGRRRPELCRCLGGGRPTGSPGPVGAARSCAYVWGAGVRPAALGRSAPPGARRTGAQAGAGAALGA